jgi:mRNA interferase RelE/StbE
MYSLIYLKSAQKYLGRLDRSVAHRIKRKVDWLMENVENIDPEWLHSKLSGLAKLREGDFRIIYEIRHDSSQVLIHAIGHRSEIYKNR